jgi:hypothetical protein
VPCLLMARLGIEIDPNDITGVRDKSGPCHLKAFPPDRRPKIHFFMQILIRDPS